jgi:hypothetical protein
MPSADSPPLPRWIVIWFVVGMSVVAWDVSFVLLRPSSMPGGSLAAFWGPYANYIAVDRSYADVGNAFVSAQAIMSAFEILVGLAALWFNRLRRVGIALLLAFTMSALTGAKTVLLLVIELVSGFESVGHNTVVDAVSMYLVPNLVWVVVPALVVVATGRRLVAAAGYDVESSSKALMHRDAQRGPSATAAS